MFIARCREEEWDNYAVILNPFYTLERGQPRETLSSVQPWLPGVAGQGPHGQAPACPPQPGLGSTSASTSFPHWSAREGHFYPYFSLWLFCTGKGTQHQERPCVPGAVFPPWGELRCKRLGLTTGCATGELFLMWMRLCSGWGVLCCQFPRSNLPPRCQNLFRQRICPWQSLNLHLSRWGQYGLYLQGPL